MFLKNSPLEVLVTAGSVAGDLGEVREVGFVSESVPLVLRSKDLCFFQFTFCFLLVVEKVSLQLSTATYIPFCCLLLHSDGFFSIWRLKPNSLSLHSTPLPLSWRFITAKEQVHTGNQRTPKYEKQRIFVSSA